MNLGFNRKTARERPIETTQPPNFIVKKRKVRAVKKRKIRLKKPSQKDIRNMILALILAIVVVKYFLIPYLQGLAE